MKKQKDSLRALEQLLSKIETDIERARLLISQMISGKVDESVIDEDNHKIEELASRLLNYNEEEAIKVVE